MLYSCCVCRFNASGQFVALDAFCKYVSTATKTISSSTLLAERFEALPAEMEEQRASLLQVLASLVKKPSIQWDIEVLKHMSPSLVSTIDTEPTYSTICIVVISHLLYVVFVILHRQATYANRPQKVCNG
jgi:hypothetical protein